MLVLGVEDTVVSYETAEKGIAVKVNGHLLGYITHEHGFFTDSGIPTTFIKVSPEDLSDIAKASYTAMGINSEEIQLV